MEHKHPVFDTDTHFTIDPITRQIKNASHKKTTLMQFDHNSERFTFECPRYIEAHDMSECNRVEVHYMNIDGNRQNSGVYTVDDLRVMDGDETQVTCSWVISANATQLAGALSFLLRFLCVDGDIITYSWNTDMFTAQKISKGIDASGAFETEYVDVIEKWKASVMAYFADALKTTAVSIIDAEFKERNKRVYLENEVTDAHGVFEAVNFAGQGERSDLYNFVMHNYTDSPILRLDNVGEGTIINAVNAHNAEHRADKNAEYHGDGDVLRYTVQSDPDGDGQFTQHLLFKIDKDGMLWWSGWNNATAGDDAQNKTVKFQTNKKDGGVWAFNFDAVNLNRYLMLLTSGGMQVMQVKTDEDGSCVIEAPNGAKLTGDEYLNLTSNGNIVIQTASADVPNSIRFRVNGVYYYPQFTNKICTSDNRPTIASAGEIYLESDTNRTIRRNAANNGWVDMNGNKV